MTARYTDAERALLADLIADAAGLAEALTGEAMDAFEREVAHERAMREEAALLAEDARYRARELGEE